LELIYPHPGFKTGFKTGFKRLKKPADSGIRKRKLRVLSQVLRILTKNYKIVNLINFLAEISVIIPPNTHLKTGYVAEPDNNYALAK